MSEDSNDEFVVFPSNTTHVKSIIDIGCVGSHDLRLHMPVKVAGTTSPPDRVRP